MVEHFLSFDLSLGVDKLYFRRVVLALASVLGWFLKAFGGESIEGYESEGVDAI